MLEALKTPMCCFRSINLLNYNHLWKWLSMLHYPYTWHFCLSEKCVQGQENMGNMSSSQEWHLLSRNSSWMLISSFCSCLLCFLKYTVYAHVDSMIVIWSLMFSSSMRLYNRHLFIRNKVNTRFMKIYNLSPEFTVSLNKVLYFPSLTQASFTKDKIVINKKKKKKLIH